MFYLHLIPLHVMKHFIAYVIVLGLYTELIRSDTEKMAL